MRKIFIITETYSYDCDSGVTVVNTEDEAKEVLRNAYEKCVKSVAEDSEIDVDKVDAHFEEYCASVCYDGDGSFVKWQIHEANLPD